VQRAIRTFRCPCCGWLDSYATDVVGGSTVAG
jgi:hypothetical protein